MTDIPRFPPVTREQWEAKAREDLEGRPLERLTHTTADGVEIAPLYLGDVGDPPPRRLGGRDWLSLQELRHADVAAANAAAREDLRFGAGALLFVVDSEQRAGRRAGPRPDGLVCDPGDRDQLDALLEGIDPARTPVFVDAGLLAPLWADALEEWLDDHDQRDPAESAGSAALGRGPSRGGVIYDPLAALCETGSLELDFEGALGRLTDTMLGMEVGLLGVSTTAYHDAGASDAGELALALASCAELLRRGAGLGLEIADLADSMIWTLAIAGRPFEAIAKLRAARLVWAKFCAAAGLDGARAWIHATSSRRSWTRHGPWVNLLRGTVGSFAAAVGGADSIATGAFDGLRGPEGEAVAGLGRGSALGRRLAINTQMILREEAQLARVIDPAGGSHYVESLTDALARAAWRRFRAIEAAGGLVEQLARGAIQAELAGLANDLRGQAARRERPLTGLSTYPVLDDQPTPAQPPNETRDEGPEPARPGPVLDPAQIPRLPRLRLAARFEELRDASEAWARARGQRPQIFACRLGPLAAHQARLDFAANCFRAAGVELLTDAAPLEGDDAGALAEQAAADLSACACRLVILCGRDEDYARLAAPLLLALRGAGAEELWIAGRPPRTEEGELGWGLDPELPPRLVHLGCDVARELEHALTILEVLSTPAAQEGN